jgi:hypothetical protein
MKLEHKFHVSENKELKTTATTGLKMMNIWKARAMDK